MTPPQSLFNRPSAALLRMRREAKQQKLRAMAGKPVVKPLPIVHRTTATDTKTADRHEWLINEDWALLQVKWKHGLTLNCFVYYLVEG